MAQTGEVDKCERIAQMRQRVSASGMKRNAHVTDPTKINLQIRRDLELCCDVLISLLVFIRGNIPRK
jgi:hypothetical protein